MPRSPGPSPPNNKCAALATTTSPSNWRTISVPVVTAAADNSDNTAPWPPPPGTATTNNPPNPTTNAKPVRAVTRSPNSHQAGSRISSGCAFASTAAVPVASPAIPANIAQNARLTLTSPRSPILPQLAADRGSDRRWVMATTARAAPPSRALSAANHNNGASRSPHRTPRVYL